MLREYSRECFELLINHEIGELKRIKMDLKLVEHISSVDNFSLVVFENEYINADNLKTIDSSLRASDVVFYKDTTVLLFLPGTDKEGAIHLIEGIKDFLGEEGKYVVVTYPEDGRTHGELMESLRLYASGAGMNLIL